MKQLVLSSTPIMLSSMLLISPLPSSPTIFTQLRTTNIAEETSVPALSEIIVKDKIVEALDLFPGIRGMTKDEAERYEKSLLKLFTPTGRNRFEL